MPQIICDRCGKPLGVDRVNISVWSNVGDSAKTIGADRIGGYRLCRPCWLKSHTFITTNNMDGE